MPNINAKTPGHQWDVLTNSGRVCATEDLTAANDGPGTTFKTPKKQILEILGSQFMKEKKNEGAKVFNGGGREPLVGQQKTSNSNNSSL